MPCTGVIGVIKFHSVYLKIKYITNMLVCVSVYICIFCVACMLVCLCVSKGVVNVHVCLCVYVQM